jgi:hypothetical protein
MFKQISITAIASLVLVAATANVATAAEGTKDEAAPAAHATEGTNKNPLSVAFLFGHGQKEAFKSGIGGRIGYTLPSGLYLGGTFVSHFGTADGPVQANVWYGGGEVGYEFEAGPFVVRPYAGAGIASVHASIYIPPIGAYEGGRIEANESRVVFWPGASVLVPLDSGRAFLGVDAKYLVVANSSAFNAYATLGVAF